MTDSIDLKDEQAAKSFLEAWQRFPRCNDNVIPSEYEMLRVKFIRAGDYFVREGHDGKPFVVRANEDMPIVGLVVGHDEDG